MRVGTGRREETGAARRVEVQELQEGWRRVQGRGTREVIGMGMHEIGTSQDGGDKDRDERE